MLAEGARALAVAVSMGYAGFLAGPVLIGAATRTVPLSVALGIPAALALLVAASAAAVAGTGSTPRRRTRVRG
ncbi:hypothetical protein ABT297_27805 [Dactylosporangium sp. NPDC000555]|uniref:hypothetical protein n=1 Tax=Dactylosporangium sp. NPDC000555 TaxID=3154260 RepID=UPI00333163D1